MNFTTTRKKLVKLLIIVALCLICLSILAIISTYVFGHGNIYGLIPLFELDSEANFPTIFSTILLVTSSFLFYFLSKQVQVDGSKASRKFKFMSALLAFIALDEISSIHELLTEPLKALGNFDGIFFHSWIVVFIPLLLLLSIYLFRFIISQPKEFRNGLILAAFIYISGALGMEMIEGLFASTHGRINLLTAVLTNIEESLEIFGTIILINTLLKFILLKEHAHEIRILLLIEEK